MLSISEARHKARHMYNTRIIFFKYCGPTSNRGTRIKLTDKHFKQSIYVRFNYDLNSAKQIATTFLLLNGWDVAGASEIDQGDEGILIIGTWNSDQQLKDTRR
tara:strand:- start:414 stop:722 length:309 start_codon:yes stop_codon:yes gene_type:complete